MLDFNNDGNYGSNKAKHLSPSKVNGAAARKNGLIATQILTKDDIHISTKNASELDVNPNARKTIPE